MFFPAIRRIKGCKTSWAASGRQIWGVRFQSIWWGSRMLRIQLKLCGNKKLTKSPILVLWKYHSTSETLMHLYSLHCFRDLRKFQPIMPIWSPMIDGLLLSPGKSQKGYPEPSVCIHSNIIGQIKRYTCVFVYLVSKLPSARSPFSYPWKSTNNNNRNDRKNALR